MQRCNIREPYEWFGMGCDNLEIEERDNLRGTVATAQALDSIDTRVCKHLHQVTRAQFGTARRPVGARQCTLSQLDAVSFRFPPRDAPQHIGVGIVGAGRADDANRATRWNGFSN